MDDRQEGGRSRLTKEQGSLAFHPGADSRRGGLGAMDHRTPFIFYTERRLVSLTGLRAHNLQQLLEIVREVSGSSIFYHTHHQFLSHHFEKPVVHSDFAQWVS